MNRSGEFCRNCKGVGGTPNQPWYECPSCHTPAIVEKNVVYWHRNILVRWAHSLTRYLSDIMPGKSAQNLTGGKPQ